MDHSSDDVEQLRVETTLKAIVELRKRLLDLSNRNRLLNYKHRETGRQARIVNTSLTNIFDTLSSDAKLKFIGLPKTNSPDDALLEQSLSEARLTDKRYFEDISGHEDDDAVVDAAEQRLRERLSGKLGLGTKAPERRTPAQVAESLGISADFTLPIEGPRNTVFQTLLFEEPLQRKIAAIRDEAISSLQERGVNTLYCSLGFLEWYESEDSDRPILSPLLLSPIAIDRVVEHSHYAYIARGLQEELEINVTLYERLNADFKMTMPEFNRETDRPIAAYFANIQLAIASQPRWHIRPFATVGLFDFTRLAMYRDLDPERRTQFTALEKHEPLLSLLGGARDGQTQSRSGEWSEDPHRREAPLLITDADSSQFGAILEALGGANFVIEGPPGTGKSQTITNLIAALLFAKKRVLFVADKLAALQVVKNRLDAAGLGDFCMELHSMKLQKSEVYDSINRRLKARSTAAPPLDTRTRIARAKDGIEQYTSALHSVVGQMGHTVHDLIWREQALRTQLGDAVKALQGRTFPGASSIDQDGLTRIQGTLSAVEPRHQRFVARFGSPNLHPLASLRLQTSGAPDLKTLRSSLERISANLARIPALIEELGINLNNESATLSLIKLMTDCAAQVAELVPKANEDACARASKVDNLDALISFGHSALANRKARASWPDSLFNSIYESSNDLEALLAIFVERDTDLATILAELQSWQNELDTVESAQAAVDHMAHVLNRGAVDERNTLDCLSDILPVLVEGKVLQQVGGLERVLASPAPEVVIAARDRAHSILLKRERLREDFDLTLISSPTECRSLAATLRSANWLESFFSQDVRNARHEFRRLSLHPSATSRSAMATAYVEIAEMIEEQAAFESSEEIASAFGEAFDGLNTAFATSLLRAELAASIREMLARHGEAGIRIERELSRLNKKQLDALAEIATSQSFADLRSFCAANSSDLTPSREREQILACMADARTAIGYWKSMQIPPELTTKDLRTMLGDVREATRLAGQLKDDSTVAFVFPPNDDTESLEGAISALKTKSLVRKAGLEEVVGSALHVMQPSDSWIELTHLYADTIQTLQDMVESENLDLNALAQGPLDETSAQDLQDRVDALVAHLEDIPEWFAYLRARETADHAGLSDILQSSLDAGIAVDRAAEYVLARTLIVEAIQTYPELRDALGQTFTALRQEFQNADRRLLEDNRTILRNDLVRRHVDPGSRVGNRGSWTGEALILNEAGKSTRHISLRDLHRRAGRAMQQLKPCYMMSPLSVAQAIEPGSIHFDVLIIDEASQMRPEDALGSVARADQIIIVGDPKQLPPTAFFDRAEASDEVADEDAVETESILDLAMQQYGRPRRLLWHYRSRHDSLIAFSNKMFYENELQVFPSPDRSGELGVRYTHISGQYQGSVNPAEAALVAERAIALMKSEPHRSLGIVTMNQRQRDLIRLEVERRAVTDRAAQRYMEDWEERLEPFLIKNLETIQGDERDIILISTLYGPDQAGNVYQRFGPINGKTGWRRLNVLFTRAKDRVEVISSLRPSDITSDERTSRGARAFRDYLDYASSGRIETGNDTGRPPDSDFEVAVAAALRNRGYECEPQVGVAGFFIDIGVRHPNNSGRFILGIECDGRSYHSNKAARDRDRLREEVLQRLGWRLHRIWSTDWFADSALEIERLISAISSAADMPASRDDGASDGGSPQTKSANFVSTQTIINELPKRVESPVSVDDLLLESDVLEAVRAVLPPGSALEREKLLRSVASRLGQPLGRKLRSTLNKSIAHEVRHGRLAVNASWSVVRRP